MGDATLLDLFEGSAAALEIFQFMEKKTGCGLFAYDLRSGVVRWSPGMHALFQLPVLEPSTELFRKYVHPLDRLSPDELHALILRGLPFERELRIILPDGRTRWLSCQFEFVLDGAGTALRMLGLCIDQTAQRASVASQLARHARFKKLVSGVAPIVWVADAAGLTTQCIGWGAVTGRSDGAALGMGWLDAVHIDDRDMAAAIWRAAFLSKDFYEQEYRVEAADGGIRRLRTTGVALSDETGTVTEWNGIAVDITPRADREATTGAQIRAARGILKWSVVDLSDASGVSPAVIRRLEEHDDTPARADAALAAVRRAIETAGVEFVFNPGKQPGVRPYRELTPAK